MSKTKQKVKEGRFTMSSILSALNTIVGVIVVVYIGHKWSNYLQLLHENQFYFSSIKVSVILLLFLNKYNNILLDYVLVKIRLSIARILFCRKSKEKYPSERNRDFTIHTLSIWSTQKVY